MMMKRPQSIGVVITTYNAPKWLELVLIGYESQSDDSFKVLIADDGSNEKTQAVIDRFKVRGKLNIEHYWHEDDGFRKTIILNKVISKTDCDYLIFTDGDCVPRSDFIAVHRQQAERGCFLSGGYLKLSMPVSEQVVEENIVDQSIFSKFQLLQLGQPSSFKLTKLSKNSLVTGLLNALTPTKPTWNGMNSSTWTDHIKSVNGFDERMQYGGLDREMGERLWNAGVKSKQIRYQAICLHLDHPRGYASSETWAKNRQIRSDVKARSLQWTDFGIVKGPKT
jgi:glycosyltransferase involved in cell wall biosynthesis